jgi:hypothetical protein
MKNGTLIVLSTGGVMIQMLHHIGFGWVRISSKKIDRMRHEHLVGKGKEEVYHVISYEYS